MNWGGLSIAMGLVVVAAAAGPAGWLALAAVTYAIWR